jgi:hypothetical protein
LSMKWSPVGQPEGSGHHSIHELLVVHNDETGALLAPLEDVLGLWIIQRIPKLADEFVNSTNWSWLWWCDGLVHLFFAHKIKIIIKTLDQSQI